MNTEADACIIEDLTSLVGPGVGADEPDMSTNDLTYVDVQDLFGSYQDVDKGQEESVVDTVVFVSPIDALKEVVLALDWELSSRNLERCLAESEILLEQCQDDQFSTALLKMLATIVKYLNEVQGQAHPDSVKVLTSVYVCLEKILSALDMGDAEKNTLVAAEVVKFKTLRQKIAASATGGEADDGVEQSSRGIDELIALKAMVLSVDWGEISQERIDAFLAEIASLKMRWQGDGTLVQGLEILRAYGQYIFVKKENSHPDSFTQFFAAYNSLERVLVSDHLTPAEKKEIVSLELQKFIALKKRIATEKGKVPESTPSPVVASVIEKHDAAKKEAETVGQEESGEAASFLTAVDSKLDNFFAEKDARLSAALQVAELPPADEWSADDEGAPAAMSDDFVVAIGDGDEGPAMVVEAVALPEQEAAAAVSQGEAVVPMDAGEPAGIIDDTISLPAAVQGEEAGVPVAEPAPQPKKAARAKTRTKKGAKKAVPAEEPETAPAVAETTAAAAPEDDIAMPLGEVEEGPALFMEEVPVPTEELVVSVMEEEAQVPTEELVVEVAAEEAAPLAEELVMEVAAEQAATPAEELVMEVAAEEAAAPTEELVMEVPAEEAAPPAEELMVDVAAEETTPPAEESLLFVMDEEADREEEDSSVSVMREEALSQTDDSSPGQLFDDELLVSTQAENGDHDELPPEPSPRVEKASRAVSQGPTISVADEIGLTELDDSLLDVQGVDRHRSSPEARAAEEVLATCTGMVSEPEVTPAVAYLPWHEALAAAVDELQGDASDTAVATLRQRIDALSAQEEAPAAACIFLDLMAAVAAQLAAMPTSERAEGAALVKSLWARLASGAEAPVLPVIRSVVHGYVVWQSTAMPMATGRVPADEATPPSPAAIEPPPVEAPAREDVVPQEPTPAPESGPSTDQAVPAGSLFGKIRQLFKK